MKSITLKRTNVSIYYDIDIAYNTPKYFWWANDSRVSQRELHKLAQWILHNVPKPKEIS
jgi:hypothetical protein